MIATNNQCKHQALISLFDLRLESYINQNLNNGVLNHKKRNKDQWISMKLDNLN